MTLLAAAKISGPHVDFAGLSPIIALAAGAMLVLMVGLLGSSFARRQVVPTLTLATLATAIGLARIVIWQQLFHVYGDHYFLIGVTVAASLIGVVLFGTLAGYELAIVRRLVAGDVVVVELSETVDLPAGRRRTDEAVVFDVSAAGLIRRIGVYVRR